MARRRREPLGRARVQTDMFAAGEDLPLLSGATYGPRDVAAFEPVPAGALWARQPSLLDLRPRLGAQPTFAPITAEEID